MFRLLGILLVIILFCLIWLDVWLLCLRWMMSCCVCGMFL